MPLELRPETEAYRLCQPMHVLSFGEGRWVWKRLCCCLRRFGMEGCVLICSCADSCVRIDEEFTCDYVRYLAPPRPRRRQWFVRRFDREPVLREFPKRQRRPAFTQSASADWFVRQCLDITHHTQAVQTRRRTTAEDGC